MTSQRIPRPSPPHVIAAMTDLVFAWDGVRRTDGVMRGRAIEDLRRAAEAAARVEDLSGLSAPGDLFRAAHGACAVWLAASDEIRAGRLGNMVEAVLGTLWSWHAGTIGEPWPLKAQRRFHNETERDGA